MKIGICTFYSDPVYDDVFGSGIDEFLNNVAEEIAKNTFDKLVLVFNELSEITDKFNKEIEKIKSLYKAEIAGKIILITGTPEEITEEVKNYVP
jgi:archaellum biogenesis ATPase FlaH